MTTSTRSYKQLILPVIGLILIAIFSLAGTATAISWTNADIGNVGVAGSADETNGTFTIQASGNAIWGQSDGFHYVYQPLNGDGEISGLVGTPQNTGQWAVSGLMIRESLSDDSAHVMVRVRSNGSVWTAQRSTTGANTSQTNDGFSSDPHWLRLVRAGNTISSYRSDDGQTWTLLQSINITMGQSVYIGMAVTAYNNSSLTTATFDNISVSGSGEATATPTLINTATPTATTPGATPTVTATSLPLTPSPEVTIQPTPTPEEDNECTGRGPQCQIGLPPEPEPGS